MLKSARSVNGGAGRSGNLTTKESSPQYIMPDNLAGTAPAINNPDLSDTLEPRVRAVRNAEEAETLVKYAVEQNRERNKKNGRIMAKYNSERPNDQAKLDAAGVGWKANFSTKPLTLLIDKSAPRLANSVEAAKYLTNSKLPDTIPGAATKTEAFRREITDLCRSRREWKPLLNQISMEDTLFGYTCANWLDEFSWFPSFFRQDEFFIPPGTKQCASSAQFIVLKEDYLLHRLFENIEDREVAKDLGWNIKNTVLSINHATPKDRLRGSETDWERAYQDMLRETNLSTSYDSGAKIVTVYHLLVTEITGKISHFILEDKDWTELFHRDDQFESMDECAVFFSFQQGNGTMHGSKGIGREIYAIAGILDRSRNDVVDRLQLAGKVIIQGEQKNLPLFKMSLVGNAILIDKAYEVVQHRIDGNVEPFLALDNYMSGILDQIAGVASPKQLEGERVTAAQVNVVASREEEQRDIIADRFLSQFSDMMSTLQRRACAADVSEDDASEMQKRLLKIMSREELDMISSNPPAGTVADFTDLERQQIALVAAENAGNPLINQKELKRRQLIAQIDEEFAEAVLLPDNDPQETAEQTRLQQLELLVLREGQPVPVSPRDNHIIHLNALMGAMESAAENVAKDPNGAGPLQSIVDHASQHIASATELGAKPEELEQYTQLVEATQAALQQIEQLNAQQAQIQGQLDAVAADEGLPPPV